MLRALFGKLSFAGLLSTALAQATSMLRYEVQLAKEELRRKIRAIAGGVVFVLIGAAFLFFVVALLLVAALVALSQVWPMWLAALVIAGALLIVASIFLAIGASRIKANSDLRPERAMLAYRKLTGASE
jgi:magnesium-transporting ATPase (P-type)